MGELEKDTSGPAKVEGAKKEGGSESRSDHKSSSSSSSHKHKHKDKDRERERDRDKDKEKSRDKDKERKDKDKSRDKEREKDRDKHKSSSSSSKDKDRERDKSRSDEKQVNGHSSSSKDKDRKDRDKDRKGKDREKDKERSKDKDRHSSSHKDKHRDKDREKERSKDKERREKDKEREKVKGTEQKHEPSPVKHDVEHSFKMEVEEEKTVVKTEVMEEMDTNVDVSDDDMQETIKVEKNTTETVESDAEDVPLSKRKPVATNGDGYDSDAPLSARKKIKTEVTTTTSVKKEKKRKVESDYDEDEYEEKKKAKKTTKKVKVEVTTTTTKKKVKKEEQESETWKWWEEEKLEEGVKWKTLQHQGPVFAPPYEPLPKNVRFYYNGKQVTLSEEAEEVATFYGRMLDHDYTSKEVFNTNFFKDWRKTMTKSERELITDLKKCDFKEIDVYFKKRSEENKNRTKEEKQKLKEENERLVEEYGFCDIDGHKQRIGNFRIEPPGLFRGRGDHPKMGMLKKRVVPQDVIINCSKGCAPSPPEGHKWKEVRHDNSVTWLASWTENVQGQVKYVMLNAASHLKGERDWQKYEIARKLKKIVPKIREGYQDDLKSKEMRIRQRAVALYFIDKLALRAGNEKDEDQADTVGCCSLRVEHVSLDEEKNGKEYVVTFDFLGKDSIRYYNEVSVEKRVFKNLQIFTENKQPGDDLFDRLNTSILNKHLNEIMEGLTAKVFRTYNASFTLQDQLDKLTNPKESVAEKVLAYNRANRAVAILCNHQRAVSKTFAKSMENLQVKVDAKREQVADAETNLKDAKKDVKRSASQGSKAAVDKCEKALARLKDQLQKLELQATDREENKDIALGTSKLNYLDPRISVAWCKKNDVPIEKVYNKTQRAKFQWAIDMAGPDFVF